MKSFFVAAALAAAVAPAAGAAPAEVGPVPPPAAAFAPFAEGVTVAIPFAPPLGTDLRYRHVEVKTRDGKPVRTRHDIVLRFDRSGDGYRMLMRIEVPDLPPEARAHPGIRFMLQPVTFRLDADGTLLSIDGEDAYWDGIERLAQEYARQDSGAEGAAMMRTILQSMRALPAEDRLQLAAKNVAPLLEFSASDMSMGETREIETETMAPIGGVPLRRTTRITLESADADSAGFVLASQPDPESLKAVLEAMFKLAPPDKRHEIPAGALDVEDTMTFRVSRTTGLTTSMRHVARAGAAGDPESAEKTVTTTLVR